MRSDLAAFLHFGEKNFIHLNILLFWYEYALMSFILKLYSEKYP